MTDALVERDATPLVDELQRVTDLDRTAASKAVAKMLPTISRWIRSQPSTAEIVARVLHVVDGYEPEFWDDEETERDVYRDRARRLLARTAREAGERDGDEPLGYSEGAQAWGYEGDG